MMRWSSKSSNSWGPNSLIEDFEINRLYELKATYLIKSDSSCANSARISFSRLIYCEFPGMIVRNRGRSDLGNTNKYKDTVAATENNSLVNIHSGFSKFERRVTDGGNDDGKEKRDQKLVFK